MRIILKFILKKYGTRVWSDFKWPRKKRPVKRAIKMTAFWAVTPYKLVVMYQTTRRQG